MFRIFLEAFEPSGRIEIEPIFQAASGGEIPQRGPAGAEDSGIGCLTVGDPLFPMIEEK